MARFALGARFDTDASGEIALTREEVFYCHRGRHPVLMWLRTGVRADGSLTAMHLRTLIDGGAYGSYGVASTFCMKLSKEIGHLAGWGQGLTMLTCFMNMLPHLDRDDRLVEVEPPAHALQAMPAAIMAARTSAPPPARAPPNA